VRALATLRAGAGDEFPAAFTEQTVVGAGDKAGTVFERHAEGWFFDAPMREDPGLHVAPLPAGSLGAVDGITNFQIGQRLER
jgi:hypothetical protein